MEPHFTDRFYPHRVGHNGTDLPTAELSIQTFACGGTSPYKQLRSLWKLTIELTRPAVAPNHTDAFALKGDSPQHYPRCNHVGLCVTIPPDS